MPIQNPNDPAGANAYGRWQYGPWFNPPTGNLDNYPNLNPYYDPNCNSGVMWCEPQYQPNVPNPSMGMESYNDTSMVNGAAYPYMEVDPTTVRFRVLNAGNDRFLNLQMYKADPTIVTSDGRTETEVTMLPAVPTVGFPELWPTDGRAGGVRILLPLVLNGSRSVLKAASCPHLLLFPISRSPGREIPVSSMLVTCLITPCSLATPSALM